MTIKEWCYEVYKADWKNKHNVTTEKKAHTIKNYLKFLKENGFDKESYPFNKYLEEFGYDGELYVCYEEFLGTEYLDHDYICGLLKSEKLIAMYYGDIKE